jgi:heterotetrameric sarcosine oxidase gamma subunit
MLSTLEAATIMRVQTWNPQEAVSREICEALGVAWPTITGVVASASSGMGRGINVSPRVDSGTRLLASGVTAGTPTGRDGLEIICINPADWLVVRGDGGPEELIQLFGRAFAGTSYRATDVSAALARIQIEGPNALTVLTKGCSLDFDSLAFPPGRAARARLAGMPVVVHRRTPTQYECIFTLSLRDYLIAWLTDAATEFRDQR